MVGKTFKVFQETRWQEYAVKASFFNFKPVVVNVPISYHLKIPEKQKIFGVFRECKMGTLAANGLGTSTALVLDLWTLGKKYDIFYISSFPRFLSINKFNF